MVSFFLKMKEGIVSFLENSLQCCGNHRSPCNEAREGLVKNEVNICGFILFLLEPTKKSSSLLLLYNIFILVKDHLL